MSDYCSILAPDKQHKLIFGYVRIESNDVIPMDLSKICFNFYNDIIRWQICGDELKQFYNSIKYDSFWSWSKSQDTSKNKESISELKGPEFMVNNIPFTMNIRPRYNASVITDDCVYLSFAINNLIHTDNIQHIMIYFILFLDEVQYEYRHTTKLTKITDALWYWPCIRFEAIKKSNYNQLSFGCYVEILNIHFDDLLKPPIYLDMDIKMKADYKYEWILNKNELERFKSAQFDYGLYSPNFNGNCFAIVCSPNGLSSSHQSKGTILTKIKLLKLPYNVKKIRCQSKLETLSKNSEPVQYFCYEEIRTFSYDKTGGAQKNESVKLSLFNNANCIAIIATVKIIDVYDQNDINISNKQWMNYGII